jgi:antitoxin component of MazEF toxin-antitoxin module
LISVSALQTRCLPADAASNSSGQHQFAGSRIGDTFFKEIDMPNIARWGNSLALRIPKSVAEAAGIKAGSPVGVRTLDSGGVLITPINGAVAVEVNQGAVHKKPDLKDW